MMQRISSLKLSYSSSYLSWVPIKSSAHVADLYIKLFVAWMLLLVNAVTVINTAV